MLQIRLSKGSSADAGAPPAKTSAPEETVTVACPDHLVLADLPVAKSLGAVTAAGTAATKSVGRRGRRQPGDKVHFCVRCDFPIAVYGRLVPCEHAFCLACARGDSSCYICDERIQKIQTIKLTERLFVCAAPHCLKSFLKRPEFLTHVHQTHTDLLQSNAEKEAASETNTFSTGRPSSADNQKQSLMPEISTARAPARPGPSPTSSSQHPDHEERNRRRQSRDPTPTPRTPLHKDNVPQGFDRPYNWFPQPQNAPQFQQSSAQFSHQPPNYQLPMNPNQALVPGPFAYAPYPTDASQPFYAAALEMPRQELATDGGSEQGSVLGIPQAVPTVVPSFPDGLPRPWGGGLMGVPFQPVSMGQAIQADPQAAVAFFQTPNVLAGKESEQQGSSAADRNDGKGVLPSSLLPPPPPPPLLPLPISQQQQCADGQGFSWQAEKHGPT